MVAVLRPGNSEAEAKIASALAATGKLDGAHVEVSVSGDVATLSGWVDCYARRLAAAEAAREVPGVRKVVDRLEIPVDGFYGWRDIDIEDAARLLLRSNYLLTTRRIDVGVDSGVLRLRGRVASAAERLEAEHICSTIPSLRGIRNDLVVVHPDARHWV